MRKESLILLQELQEMTSGRDLLGLSDEEKVKSIFKRMLDHGDLYDLADLERWLTAKACARPVIDRLMNMAHYQKTKFEANNKLRFVSGDGECGCGH